MSLMASASGGSQRELAPEGSEVARCYRLIDLGTQHNELYGNDKHQVLVTWELPNTEMTEGEFAGKPFAISRFYTLSFSEKANLRKDVESWRGKAFTDKEIEEGFDVATLVGQTCLIGVSHKAKKDGSMKEDITSLMKLPKGMKCPKSINDCQILILSPEEYDNELFESLSDGLKDIVRKSPEWQALTTDRTQGEEEPPWED